MERLVFIANFSKTEFYLAVAQELMDRHKAKIYWISATPYWTCYLKAQGVGADRILDLQEAITQSSDSQEAPLSTVGINRLLMIDRGWRKNPHLTVDNLRRAYRMISNFIVRNDIGVVCAEVTWAIELLTKRIMEEQGRLFVFPHTMRVPSDRFVFFVDQEASFLKLKQDSSINEESVTEIVDAVVSKGLKPFYFSGNNKVPGRVSKSRLHLFREYLQHLPLLNHTGMMDMTIADLLRIHVGKFVNYRSVKGMFSPIEGCQGPYVLFALQLQPESSVEVLGEGLANQIELIKWVAYALPDGIQLWVKEHSNALGVRSAKYYKELTEIPNVVLVDPFYPSLKLIPDAMAVASVSSTLCLEAALMGVPAIVFSKPFFHEMSNVQVCRSPEDVANFLERCKHSRPQPDLEFFASVLKASYPGIIAGPLDYPGVMSEENVGLVASGFNELLLKAQAVC